MQTFMQGTRGLSLLMRLNWDRILYVGTVGGALTLAAYLVANLN